MKVSGDREVTEFMWVVVPSWRLDSDVFPVQDVDDVSDEVEELCAAIDAELAEHERANPVRRVGGEAPVVAFPVRRAVPDSADGSEAA